jgi:Ni/Co efflux regulator RcnB
MKKLLSMIIAATFAAVSVSALAASYAGAQEKKDEMKKAPAKTEAAKKSPAKTEAAKKTQTKTADTKKKAEEAPVKK